MGRQIATPLGRAGLPELRIVEVDPQGDDALALLRQAAVEARALYPELFAPGTPEPTNAPTPPRGVYLVGYGERGPLACGALRPVDATTVEVRRMFVTSAARRRGCARTILLALERRAIELGYTTMVLETGHRQRRAMRLYASAGFERIAPFGPYANDPTSVCYRKRLLPVEVVLEPRTAAHAQAMFALLAEPALYAYLDDGPPASVDALRSQFARTESLRSPDGTEHWLNWVVHDADRCIAGCVQATIGADGRAHVAYVFGSAFRGRGLATAAVAQMLDIVTREHGVRCFFVVIDRRNRASQRLAGRLGFVEIEPARAAHRGIAATDLLMRRVLA